MRDKALEHFAEKQDVASLRRMKENGHRMDVLCDPKLDSLMDIIYSGGKSTWGRGLVFKNNVSKLVHYPQSLDMLRFLTEIGANTTLFHAPTLDKAMQDADLELIRFLVDERQTKLVVTADALAAAARHGSADVLAYYASAIDICMHRLRLFAEAGWNEHADVIAYLQHHCAKRGTEPDYIEMLEDPTKVSANLFEHSAAALVIPLALGAIAPVQRYGDTRNRMVQYVSCFWCMEPNAGTRVYERVNAILAARDNITPAQAIDLIHRLTRDTFFPMHHSVMDDMRANYSHCHRFGDTCTVYLIK